MRTRFGRIRRPVGFSVIELLVVIAIIGVLIGLILPALGAARNAARQAVCLSNLRQIHVASNLYAQDNKGIIAREGTAGATPETFRDRIPWCVAYRPYLDTKVSSGVDPNDLFAGALYYRCPSKLASKNYVHYADNGFAFFSDGNTDTRGAANSPTVFQYRRGPMPQDTIPFPTRMLYISEFADDPGDTMYSGWLATFANNDINLGQCYDLWLPQHVIAGIDPSNYRLGPTRHGNGANALYLDGHARKKSAADLSTLSTWQDDVYAR